ncbi:hypothetical protein WBG78_09775 [Chryseolinea sp. T2]|uniref:hypothetical protein n=1 Tax=Chryseolinea sp. T2 TaxID=3129255 RepID=UPI003077DEFA
MLRPRHILLLFVTMLVAVGVALGQTEPENKNEAFRRNKISLAVTHTFVPTTVNSSGDKTYLSLASWGLDYDYRITPQWGIGLHSDLVIQDFEYEDDDVVRKRVKPLAMAVVGTRKFGEHLTVVAGGGAEFSRDEETLALIRLGVDYGWELPAGLELSFSITTDFKINAYNALVFGFAVGKTF